MFSKRRLIFLFVVTSGVVTGTYLALSSKRTPKLLDGLHSQILDRQNVFVDTPTGRVQLTAYALDGIEGDALGKRIDEYSRAEKAAGRTPRGFIYSKAGDKTVLIESGPARPLEYGFAWLTNAGRPPSTLSLNLQTETYKMRAFADSAGRLGFAGEISQKAEVP